MKGIIDRHIDLSLFGKKSLIIKFYGYKNLIFGYEIKDEGVIFKFNDAIIDNPLFFEKILVLLIGYSTGKKNRGDFKRESSQLLKDSSLKITLDRKYKNYTSNGIYYDLKIVSEEFKDDFSEVGVQNIFWSKRVSKKKLGFADLENRAIVISKIFDSKGVPEFVLKFLICHELLHFKFPPIKKGNRIFLHHRVFREAERKCKYYREGTLFLKNFV